MLMTMLISVCSAFSVFTVLSLLAVTRDSRRRYVQAEQAPPVTVLKPLCGADDDLEANLTTFFVQCIMSSKGVNASSTIMLKPGSHS